MGVRIRVSVVEAQLRAQVEKGGLHPRIREKILAGQHHVQRNTQ